MAFEVQLPHVGESVTEAVIGKWLKSAGDVIEKYDPLVEVITDKVVTVSYTHLTLPTIYSV